MGMIVALVMLIVGSNIARAFALVGALSIIRFRNAVKETRDVGFIFCDGHRHGDRHAVSTRSAIVATRGLSSAILLMERRDWFKVNLRAGAEVQVPSGEDFSKAMDDALLRFTHHSD